jgi:hypothetical protein
MLPTIAVCGSRLKQNRAKFAKPTANVPAAIAVIENRCLNCISFPAGSGRFHAASIQATSQGEMES